MSEYVLPRCAFQAGTPYQCPRSGIGNPPLCRRHYTLVQQLEEEEPEEKYESDLLGDAMRMILGDPAVQDLLHRAKEALRQSGHNDPHYAEWPPRPPPSWNPAPRPTPPPPPPPRVPEPPKAQDPRVVLGFAPDIKLTPQMVKKRHRELAALYHPDRGGSEEAMKLLNNAVERLLAQVR